MPFEQETTTKGERMDKEEWREFWRLKYHEVVVPGFWMVLITGGVLGLILLAKHLSHTYPWVDIAAKWSAGIIVVLIIGLCLYAVFLSMKDWIETNIKEAKINVRIKRARDANAK